MTDSEKLDLILTKLEKLDALESDVQELKRRTTSIELHLENVTDKNVQLIAENFIRSSRYIIPSTCQEPQPADG